MIHHAIFSADSGALRAVQQHAAYLAFRRIVIAVSMPLDGAVGVGDVGLPLPVVMAYGDAGDALFSRQPIGIQTCQSELRGEALQRELG